MLSSPIEYSEPIPAAALFQILDSVLEPKSCAYVAGPLNSGRIYYERIVSGDRSQPVRAENECLLSGFVLGLRKRLHYPVFDSGLLKIASWSGRDYGTFFLEVIRRYAKECWFVNGWEYSTGATEEFVFCCGLSVPCFAESGERLILPEGLRLIRTAADYVRSLNLDDTKLRSREKDLILLEGEQTHLGPK
jgi:hypothetical protein